MELVLVTSSEITRGGGGARPYMVILIPNLSWVKGGGGLTLYGIRTSYVIGGLWGRAGG